MPGTLVTSVMQMNRHTLFPRMYSTPNRVCVCATESYLSKHPVIQSKQYQHQNFQNTKCICNCENVERNVEMRGIMQVCVDIVRCICYYCHRR